MRRFYYENQVGLDFDDQKMSFFVPNFHSQRMLSPYRAFVNIVTVHFCVSLEYLYCKYRYAFDTHKEVLYHSTYSRTIHAHTYFVCCVVCGENQLGPRVERGRLELRPGVERGRLELELGRARGRNSV